MAIECVFFHRQHEFTLDVNITFANQGVTVLFGASGSGKTTLLNCICGLIKPQRGLLALNNLTLVDTRQKQFVKPHRRNIGIVFQKPSLFPNYSVENNLKFSKPFDSDNYDLIVDTLGLTPLLKKRPHQLSGGEQQRVAIGRALLSKPKLLLLDEPLSALDAINRTKIMALLKKLSRSLNIPMIYVTHQLEEVTHLADQLAVIDQGKIHALGPVSEIWHHSHFKKLIAYDQASSMIDATVATLNHDFGLMECHLNASQDCDEDSVSIWTAGYLPQGETVRLVIYANDVSVSTDTSPSSALNQLPCRLVGIEHEQNDTVLLTLQLHKERLYSRITRWSYTRLGIEVNDPLIAQIKSVAIKPLNGPLN